MVDEKSTLKTTKQAALYLSVSESFLEKDRTGRRRIPFIKMGTRTVRYRTEDLDLFINKNIHG